MGQKLTSALGRLLLVQSNIIVGLDIADDLERQNYEVAGPMPYASAIEWLGRDTPDLAIVDVDLQSGLCVDLVRRLRARGVPMLVLSCHEQRYARAEFRNLPWIPILGSRDVLHAAIRELARARRLSA